MGWKSPGRRAALLTRPRECGVVRSDGVMSGLLSRRDSMKVAWQFIARNGFKKASSRRVRCELVSRRVQHLIAERPFRPNHTVPYGTALFFSPIPGSKLPGYFHLVPSGQNPGCLRNRLGNKRRSRTRTTTSTRTIGGANAKPRTPNAERGTVDGKGT
jgi:hypothetical protein